MTDAQPSQSTRKAPSLIAYEARWAAAAMARDLADMGDAREEIAGSLDIIERLAEGAVAPWTPAVAEAVKAIRAGLDDLDRAVRNAVTS